MCLVLVAVDPHGDVPLTVAANRDERHDRAADALGWWPDRPGILAGRDRLAGGTWFGAGRDGRFASVLNDHRVPAPAGAPSRGELVPAFLESSHPQAWMQALELERSRYAGFHFLAGGVATGLAYCASLSGAPVALGPGLHTIDNAGLDNDDPRSERARERVGPLLRDGEPEAILDRLGDCGHPGDGRGDCRAIFIQDAVFGTRCSTVLQVDASGFATCRERRFDARGGMTGESSLSWQSAQSTVAPCGE